MPSDALSDPVYAAAVLDLLGALAYGELMAFDRLAEDSRMAPTMEDKAALAAMASAEFGHFRRLRDRLTSSAPIRSRRWSRSAHPSTPSTPTPRRRTGSRA